MSECVCVANRETPCPMGFWYVLIYFPSSTKDLAKYHEFLTISLNISGGLYSKVLLRCASSLQYRYKLRRTVCGNTK